MRFCEAMAKENVRALREYMIMMCTTILEILTVVRILKDLYSVAKSTPIPDVAGLGALGVKQVINYHAFFFLLSFLRCGLKGDGIFYTHLRARILKSGAFHKNKNIK